MLQLRPNCECCDKDLRPNAVDARICTYECTFCTDCVDSVLHNVCPNCGGGFAPRPIRPVKEWRSGVSLEQQPTATDRVHMKYTRQQATEFALAVRGLEPQNR